MRKVPKKITVRMLERMGACQSGIEDFRRVFGKSAAFVPGTIYEAEADAELRHCLWWFLCYLDNSTANEVSTTYCRVYEGDRGARLVPFAAAALCRLARSNLPRQQQRRKAAAGRSVARG